LVDQWPGSPIGVGTPRRLTRGYLTQEVSDSDGREKRLFATSAGEDLLTELIEVSRRRQDEWLAPLSQAERKMFFELARKIAEGPNLLKSEIMR
jgi:hypothetical protein